MQRISELLKAHSYRQAMVRLWVLGSSGPTLNEWEQRRSTAERMLIEQARFLGALQSESPLTVDEIAAAPLSFIRALDDHVASTNSSYNRATRFDSETQAWREEGQVYWLVPVVLQARRHASLIRQPASLRDWFWRHVVLPAKSAHGLHVKVSVVQKRMAEVLEDIWQEREPSLKVWIGHFNDSADVTWTRNEIGNWRTASVLPHETRVASLVAAMKAAADAGAQLIVFPEFTLDLAQRAELVTFLYRNPKLSPLMVVAGSFHDPVDDRTFNTAPLYEGGTGETLLTHRKLRIFGDKVDGAEQVALGDTMHVLVTPIGCMTLLICKDFMDADPSVESLLTEVPVDWILVPSFGDEKTIRAHKDRAKSLAIVKTGSSTVVAQTLNTAISKNVPPMECVRGFGHAAGVVAHEPHVGEAGGLVTFKFSRLSSLAPIPPKPHQEPSG